MDRKNDKQIWVTIPDWLKEVEDKEVFGAIGALMFDWNFSGADKIDNLEEFLKEMFPKLSDEKRNQVAELLIEHKVLQSK